MIAEADFNYFYNIGIGNDFPGGIRKVSSSGIITTVAGTGVAGFSGDGGPATIARLNAPLGVAVDGIGNVYVADAGNQVVRVLRPVTQSVLVGAVVDAASQRAGAIAPGQIVVIYGAGLGPVLLTQAQPSETAVSINGTAARILYTSATQVAVIVPSDITRTPAQVTVTYRGQISAAYSIPVAVSAPGLFTVNQAGWG